MADFRHFTKSKAFKAVDLPFLPEPEQMENTSGKWKTMLVCLHSFKNMLMWDLAYVARRMALAELDRPK